MKPVLITTLILCFFMSCKKQNNEAVFYQIYTEIQTENYFKARDLFTSNKNDLSIPYCKFVDAILKNAFNQTNESEKMIHDLLMNKQFLPDTLELKLLEIVCDNAIKNYAYTEATTTIETILSEYQSFLSDKKKSDYKNMLKLWNALKDIYPQQIEKKQMIQIKMGKDLVGSNTLKIVANNDTTDFLFDTGANISTIAKSVATKMGMTIVPENIKVGTITGNEVEAQLAVSPKFSLGDINIYNVVFLVLPDDLLAFPQVNYQIYGILGYPVIEALGEIQITQKGDFIVPFKDSEFKNLSNMALEGLQPLICINKMHFTFDTGADKTILYQKFFEENKENITSQYKQTTLNIGGAGGIKPFDGYEINYTFNIQDKPITLQKLSVFKDKVKDDENVYGNIGQDLIQSFDTMIINFNKMYIDFK